jgi:anti-anti-sigma regulatory factor
MLDAWSRVQLFGWLHPASLVARIKEPHSTPIIFLVVLGSASLSNLAWGVAVGLLCAVFVFVQRQSQSVVRRSGTIGFRRSVVMRNAAQNECLQAFSGRVMYFELQGALFFGTSEQLLKAIRASMDANIELLILDARKVQEIDDSGCETIERLQGDMIRRGGALVLSGWSEEVQRVSRLEIVQLKQAMKQPNFRSLDEAIEFAEDYLIQKHGSADAKVELCDFDPEGKQLRLLQALPQDLRARLLATLQRCVFSDGQHIFHKGDASNDMYIVVCGRVDIWLNHTKADAVRLASFRHGVSFGEMGLLRNEARAADAVAVGEVQALRLSRESLNELRLNSPALLAHVLGVISEDLSNRLGQTNGALRLALE